MSVTVESSAPSSGTPSHPQLCQCTYLAEQNRLITLENARLSQILHAREQEMGSKDRKMEQLLEELSSLKHYLEIEQEVHSPKGNDELGVIVEVSEHELSGSRLSPYVSSDPDQEPSPDPFQLPLADRDSTQQGFKDYREALSFLKNYPASSETAATQSMDSFWPVRDQNIPEAHKQTNRHSSFKPAQQMQSEFSHRTFRSLELSLSACSSDENLVSRHLAQIEKLASRLQEMVISLIRKPQRTRRLKGKMLILECCGGIRYEGSADELSLLPSGFGKLLIGEAVIYQGNWQEGFFHGWGRINTKLFLQEHRTDQESAVMALDGSFSKGKLVASAVLTFANQRKLIALANDPQQRTPNRIT